MTGSKRVCVILGAGASYDVRSDASPVITPELRPPLAESLFDAENSAFWPVLERYPGASFLAQNLISDLANGTGLEDALRHYAEHPSEQLRQRFKHIPPYLRDLLWLCSEQYTKIPSGYVRLVTQLLAEHPHEVMFIVMNYDDLLEKALTSFDGAYTFDKLPYYIAEHRSAKVVKLHGSIDWFRPMPAPADLSWAQCVEELNVQNPYADIQVIKLGRSTRDTKVSKDLWGWEFTPWVYPVLTAPLAGKGLADAVCPGSHQAFARKFLATCAKVLVIGASGMDDDLLGLLDSSMNGESTELIHFVGKGDGANAALTSFQKGVGVFRDIRRVNQFKGGFQEYVNGPDFNAFAADGLV